MFNLHKFSQGLFSYDEKNYVVPGSSICGKLFIPFCFGSVLFKIFNNCIGGVACSIKE